MPRLTLATACLNQTPLDWDGNRKNISRAIALAKEAGAAVLLLPELCITGYGCEDQFLSPGLEIKAMQTLKALAPESAGMVVVVGLPLESEEKLYNTAAVLADGKIVGFAAKQNLANDGIHYEPRWFSAWQPGEHVEIEASDGRTLYMGDVIFDFKGVKIGFEICEDAWVVERPAPALAAAGAQIILCPAASHFAFDKYKKRRELALTASKTLDVTYVYANLAGNESGRAIFDAGCLIAQKDKFIAEGPRFTYHDVVLTAASVEISEKGSPKASPEPVEGPARVRVVDIDFTLPEAKSDAVAQVPPAWETGPHLKEEEFARAVALGLFDYLRKSRSKGFVISLSGGADSSACACLVRLMIALALHDIGEKEFKQKLGYILRLAKAEDLTALTHELLLCAYQATNQSSRETFASATHLAEELGTRYVKVNIQKLVDEYSDMAAKALGRELSWESDDLAMQNIQARVRAPGVWMLANLTQSLLLATSNRSEASVGYATMDGDTCGGLAPLAGIDKAYLRQWLKWLETTGPEKVGPLTALKAVNEMKPTAELRPKEKEQTDESDLMPYDVLDVIERAAVRDRQTPVEAWAAVREAFPKEDAQQLKEWVIRFYTLWCRSQWKRERFAPSFHVDDSSVDPKTWCRFPILSGGFKKEIEELREEKV